MVPLSQVRTASSVARSSMTPTGYCGAIGLRLGDSRSSMSERHVAIAFWYFSRWLRSILRVSIGTRACRLSFASPTTGTSVGIRTPARVGSASICTTRTLPGAGRCWV